MTITQILFIFYLLNAVCIYYAGIDKIKSIIDDESTLIPIPYKILLFLVLIILLHVSLFSVLMGLHKALTEDDEEEDDDDDDEPEDTSQW